MSNLSTLSQTSPSSQSRDRREPRMGSIEQLLLDLCHPDRRENALVHLSKEVVSIYPYLTVPNLSAGQSTRVCNALALLQCVASHPETKILFLNAHIPLYLYPFLNTTSKERPLEFLRLTSLGVIGSLVKVDNTEVIGFLLQTEIIPLCLRTIEYGSQLSKEVATFIVQKVLLDDVGLWYVCATPERFFAVIQVLTATVESVSEQPSARLLKHVIRCCLRLCDSPRACEAFQEHLPKLLREGVFDNTFYEDPATLRWLQQLLFKVYGKFEPTDFQGGVEHMMGN